MPFIPRNWQDTPSVSTPINSAGLKDLEERVARYAEEAPIGSSQLPTSVVKASSSGGIVEWKAKTNYAVNVLVQSSGVVYICKEAHESGETFSGVGSRWAVLGGSNLENLVGNRENVGEVSGEFSVDASKASFFELKLKGAASLKEVKNTPPHIPVIYLEVEPNGFTLSLPTVRWLNSEPTLPTTGKFLLTLILKNGEILATTGLEGPRGGTGPIGLEWERAWSSATTYKVNQGVTNEGTSYICVRENSNQKPPNSTYWDVLAEKGVKGEAGATTSIEGFTKVVTPLLGRSMAPTNEAVIGEANKGVFVHCVIAVGGTLHDLAVFNAAITAASHLNAAIYDCGVTEAEKYTQLWESGSVAIGEEKKWQKLGDPALTVTAGQHLLFAIMTDSTTTKFGTYPSDSIGAAIELPSEFMPVSGKTLPKLCGSHKFSEFKFNISHLTEAQISLLNLPIALIARIV